MAAPKAFFIAGTDTGVGKTVVACALLEKARQQGMTTAAIKPVAAGCELTEEGLRNEDALLLQASSTLQLAYAEINPVALAPAVAPHLAADMAGKRIQLDRLAGYCRGVLSRKADFTVVEGAGGWRVPVNSHEYLSGLPAMLGLPVILVVAMRLGCLNHALLTVESIRNDGLPLAGWVANQADQTPMDLMTENLSALQQRIAAPCLGVLAWQQQLMPASLSAYLALPDQSPMKSEPF